MTVSTDSLSRRRLFVGSVTYHERYAMGIDDGRFSQSNGWCGGVSSAKSYVLTLLQGEAVVVQFVMVRDESC